MSIARRLREISRLLQDQGAGWFRTQAYRRAAEAISVEPEPMERILRRGGRAALVAMPRIGDGIAGVIEELVLGGRSRLLERLRDGPDPERLFRTLPGVGPRLAEALHRDLHLETLEEVEQACHDGRLEAHPSFGPRRVEGLQAAVSQRLAPRRNAGKADVQRSRFADDPDVDVLLAIDADYRRAAEAGRLPRIAPRRFNPEREVWLPVGHYDRDGWHFTVFFSNTARAHRLGRTADWVLIYFYDHDHREGQCTVVTETSGAMRGLRVVRGREGECLVRVRKDRSSRCSARNAGGRAAGSTSAKVI